MLLVTARFLLETLRPNRLLLLLPLSIAIVINCRAQVIFTTLATFNGQNGAYPEVSFVQGRNGNLFGTTGPPPFQGTIFELNRTGDVADTFHFCDYPPSEIGCPDGNWPEAGLIRGSNGNLYGTTAYGGVHGSGTAFMITEEGRLTTLHDFDIADGAVPQAPLLLATDGNFYGTTSSGGSGYACSEGARCGTAFKMTPEGEVTTLHSFCVRENCPDGWLPWAGLVQASDGNFYGMASAGGNTTGICSPDGCGTIFKISLAGNFTTIYTFCSQSDCADGFSPTTALMQGTDSNLYGTTVAGGMYGNGTIFKLNLSGTFTTLYSFCSQPECQDGGNPDAQLIQATDGNFYGTTQDGGPNAGRGTIFSLTPSGVLTTLYTFCTSDCLDGENPVGGLLQATDGNFYGVTPGGGVNGVGTAFRLSNGLGPLVTLEIPFAKIGQSGGILGQGLTETTAVALNSVPTTFEIVSDNYLRLTIPAGATSGYVTVTTPKGVLTSNQPLEIIQ